MEFIETQEMEELKNSLKKDGTASFIIADIMQINKPKKYIMKENEKVIDILVRDYPNGFTTTSNYFLNGTELKVENLDYEVKPGDVIFCVLSPAALGSILVSVLINVAISMVVSYVLSLLMPKPSQKNSSGDLPSQRNSVIGVGQITAAPGQVVPIMYGVNATFPNRVTDIARNYNNGTEDVYFRVCLGYGQYELVGAKINDTDIANM